MTFPAITSILLLAWVKVTAPEPSNSRPPARIAADCVTALPPLLSVKSPLTPFKGLMFVLVPSAAKPPSAVIAPPIPRVLLPPAVIDISPESPPSTSIVPSGVPLPPEAVISTTDIVPAFVLIVTLPPSLAAPSLTLESAPVVVIAAKRLIVPVLVVDRSTSPEMSPEFAAAVVVIVPGAVLLIPPAPAAMTTSPTVSPLVEIAALMFTACASNMSTLSVFVIAPPIV